MINADGAGTTVQDIRLENTGMWIYNTSNVTFTGVTFYVDNAYVCNGVGHVAVRYSNNITFDGCTVYTKNNGGSSACVLTPGLFYVFCDNSYRTYYFGSIRFLTSAMHHPKTLIGQALLHLTIVNYTRFFSNKIIKVSLFDITI